MKKKVFSLMMTLVLAFVGLARAQELTVYDGTVTNQYVPAYVFYFDDFTRSQYVIPADDLAEMNGSTISSVKFYTTSNNIPYTSVSDVDVYLMEVGYTTMSAFEPKANGTIVYQGTLDFVSEDAGGALTIEFSTPYTYGGGNLLVGIENTTDVNYKNISFYGQTVTGASWAGYNSSSLDGVTGSQRNFIPKTTFEFSGGATITCPKPTALAATLVQGNSSQVTLSWTENGEATQWQVCLDGDESNLVTATSNPFTLNGIVPEVTHTAKVRAYCDASDQSAWSNTVSFETSDKIRIGSGTGTNSYLPTNCFYKYSLTQQIYTAEEIGIPGAILGLDFQCKTDVTRNLDIYMVSTDKASFSSATDWITVTADDLVYSGEVSFTANVWTPIVFDNAFAFDGTNNVALIVDDNTGSYQSSYQFLAFNAEAQAIYVYNDNTDYNPMSPSSYNGTVLNQKNQIRLDVASASMYTITVVANPEEGGTVTGGGNAIEGRQRTITATPNEIYNFINWTKGSVVVSTEPSYTFTVTEDATFVANFGLKPTVIVSNPETLDLGDRPNNAWMRPFNFTLTNTGAPANVASIATSNDYFTVETGDLEVPFTFGYEETIDLGMGWGSGTGAISANVIISFADAAMAPQEIAVTANAYAPVAGDVWETAIPVTEFPYTATLNAASLPLYNNYVMPFSNIEDGYDVVYQLTFTEDTYLQATIDGENGKMALYTEDFYGVGGPDAANNYRGASVPTRGNRDGEELTVLDGTNTNSYVPVYGYYADAYLKCEFVYPSEELADMAGGEIGNLKFYASTANASWTSNFQVFMKEVDETTLSDFTGMADATLVYEGTLAVVENVMNLELATPYVYNGGNLLVGFYNTTTGNYSSVSWLGQSVEGASVQGYGYNGLETVSATQRNFLPKVTFTYIPGDVDTGITDKTLVPGTYYLVASATSSEFGVTIDTEAVPCPDAVTYVAPENNAMPNSINNLQLKWRLGARTTEYCLLLGADNANNMQVVVDWTRDLANSYTFDDAINHTKYFWQVVERNDGCPDGVAGEVMSFVTPLNGPTNLRAVDGVMEITEGQALNLAWDAPADRALYYNYKLYQNGVQVYNGNNTEYSITGLTTQEDAYAFNVVASYYLNNEWVESSSSNYLYIDVIGQGTLTGHVYEQDGTTAIAGATVTIFGYDEFNYWHEYELTTNANGLFASSLATGSNYSAYANAPGYQEAYYDGTITIEQGSTTTGINIVMDEVFAPVFDVTAAYVGDNPYDGDAVEVTWELTSDAWHTYCENEFNNAYRNNVIHTTWAYKYPADVLADYVGYSLTRVALFSDNLYGAVYGNYTCSVYVGGETPDEGLLVSTITVNVPQGMNKWVKYNLDTPVEVSENTETLWVVWTANDNLSYPAGCTTGDNENGNWWYTIEDEELTWTHMEGICWTMLNRFEDASGRSVVLGNNNLKAQPITADNAQVVIGEGATVCINGKPAVVPMAKPDRSLAYYRVYRTDWFNEADLNDQNAVLVADNVTETSYVDETFGELGEGTYKYGVSCVYEGNRESRITWLAQTFGTSQEAVKINSFLSCGNNRDAVSYDFEDGQIPALFVNDANYPWTVVDDAPEGFNGTYCIKSGNGGVGSSTSAIETTLYFNEAGTVSFLGGCWGEGTSTAWDKCLFYIDGVQQFSYGALQAWDTYSYSVEPGEHTLRWAYSKDGSVNPAIDAFFIDDLSITGIGEPPTPLQLERESEVTWSNPMDKGMYLYNAVDITVTLNSGDSPEGVMVYFGQEYDQYAINPLNSTLNITLDETGTYAWDVFRKGEYYVEVYKEGYSSYYEAMTIDGETHLVVELREIVESPENLYVSRTGWAIWNGIGNDVPEYIEPGFIAEFSESFEDGIPSDWTLIDADGDGYNWVLSSELMSAFSAHSGYDMVSSASYLSDAGALTPDNYLVTPLLSLDNMLSFWVCAQDASWGAEHFGVAISTTGNTDPDDFEMIDEWTLTAKGIGGKTPVTRNGSRVMGSWYNFTIDLSEYAGQEGYIAFRHFDCTDQFYLDLDDVEIGYFDRNDRHFENTTVTVTTLEGETLYEGTTENNYMQLPTDNLVEGEVYVCTVANNYSSAEAEVSTRFRYEPCDHFDQAEDLAGLAGSNGVELSWSYPEVEDPTGTRDYWYNMFTFDASSGYQYGIASDGTNIYTSAWSSSAGFMFAKYEMDGTFVETFTVDGCGYCRDLTYDGQYFYGVACTNTVYCIDLANKVLISSFTSEYGAMRGIGYDEENDGFWVIGNWSGDLTRIDREGNVVFTGPTPTSVSGLDCFFTENEGNAHVYLLCQTGFGAEVYDYDIANDTLYAEPILDLFTALNGNDGGTCGGAFVGEYNGIPAFFGGLQQTPNRFGVFSLEDYIPEPAEMGECIGAMVFRDGELVAFTGLSHYTDEEGTIDNEYELRLVYGGAAYCPYDNNALSMSCPQTFDLEADEITQVSAFQSGWNWWSSYVELGENGIEMLEEGLGNNGVMIKSQNDGYSSYLEGYGWYGSLQTINNENTYQVRVNTACEVEMAAAEADPADHPIMLHNGWTWIGYPVGTSMAIADALGGIIPSNGDMLKSQNDGYASYLEGYGWYGSLSTLNPGMGLMYKSNNTADVELVYPANGTRAELKANLTADANHFVPNLYAYPDNMSVMAVVELDDEELRGENYELAAFANGEVRGSVTLSYVEPLDRYMAFLTVAGEDVTELTFGLYDAETGMEVMDCTQVLSFSVNAVAGSFAEPYVVSFRGTTALDEFGKSLQVYPNPVAAGDLLNIGMANDGSDVRVEIVNALGAVVSVENSTKVAATFKAPSVPGIYTVRITAEGKGTYCRKLVVR